MFNKFLIFISIFTPLTNLYPLLATISGVSFGAITFVFCIINFMILVINYNDLYQFIRKNLFYKFLFFLLIAPLIVICYTYEFNFSYIFLNMYFLSLVAVSAVLCKENHKYLLRLTIFAALLLNLTTSYLSISYPELFLIMAESFDKSIYAGGRAFGLFLQPNILGHSSLLILILSIFAFYNRNDKKYFFVALSLSIFIIVLSGSRSTFLFMLIALFAHYLLVKSKSLKNYFSYEKYFFTLLAVASLSVLNSPEILNSIEDNLSRLKTSFDVTEFSKDASQQERIYKREAYIERIEKAPIFGHGLGTQFSHKEEGKLKGSAHNVHVDIVYQGGIIFYLFAVVFFTYLFVSIFRLRKSNKLLWSYGSVLILIFFGLSFVSSSLMQLRVLYIVFGPLFILSHSKK